MQVYRRLFYNNIQGFLAQAFPVLHLITEEKAWHQLVRRFYAQHRCQRPQFYQVAEEFIQFLQRDDDASAPPFRLELAHYEWLELHLAIDSTPLPAFKPCRSLQLEDKPVFSPYMELSSYRWPVHKIAPDYLPQEAPVDETYLLVFRDLQEEVCFLQINPLTAALIERLRAGDLSIDDAFSQLADEVQLPMDQLQRFGQPLLADFLARGLILGSTVSC